MYRCFFLFPVHVQIPQTGHNCTQTGMHCCGADAPFDCCCSIFKEAAHKQSTVVLAKQKGREVADKMARFANTYFGHDKVHAKIVRDEIKALFHPVHRRVVGDEITAEAMAELRKIEDFQADKMPKEKSGSFLASKAAAGTEKIVLQKSASETRGAERRELMKDVGEDNSEKVAERTRTVRVAERFADQYFTDDQSHAALRKQLEQEANTTSSKLTATPVIADSDPTLASTKTATARLQKAAGGPRVSFADKITEEAIQEYQKDKSLEQDDADSASSSPRSNSKSVHSHARTQEAASMFESSSDASARAWMPPKVNFAGLFGVADQI